QPLLQDAVASDPEADRCLCHPVGTPQVQADAPPDQRCERLVRPDTSGQPNTLCSLDVMSWQRPNIGSRVTREGHARFWERPEVNPLGASRKSPQTGSVVAWFARRWRGNQSTAHPPSARYPVWSGDHSQTAPLAVIG